MKKVLMAIVLCMALTTSGNSSNTTTNSAVEKEQMVWICTGKSSECYHKSKTCRGLGSCRAEKKEVTLERAKDMGRRPCKMCYY